MKTIALVIRGKHSEDHDPGVMDQHADVVLSTGEPVGFFGSGGGVLASAGMGLNGFVANYHTMAAIRPQYTDADVAARDNVVSTICTLRVPDDEAKRFDEFWTKPSAAMKKELRDFSLLGDNCSTAASMAFQHAGILKKGIPGLDTPDNLYHQLKLKYGANFSCSSGHVGFEPEGAGYRTVVK